MTPPSPPFGSYAVPNENREPSPRDGGVNIPPAPPSTTVDVPQLEVGQLFSPNTKDLRRTCEEWFLARGHGMVCGSLGGGRQKAYYCGGAKMEGVPGKSDAKRRVGGCAAVIRFTRVTATKEWRLSRIDTAHKDCDDKGPRFSVRVAQQLSKSIITADPSIRSSAIADHLRASHGGTISERQATRVRAAVNAGKKHGREHGYRLLTSYLKELSQHSQGGYVTNIERDAGRRFKRCFVMNARGAHVVSSGPCDILSIDSGQLKGVFDGTILALTGKDADNKVVIIAFALCDAESTESVENFSFLLRNSKENAAFAAFVDSPRTTIMTGCHPGYPPVLREAVPRSEPKLCVEQMLRDAGNIGSTLRNAVSLAARAPTRSTFDASLKDIKEIMPEAYEYMMKTPLGSWTFHAGRKNRTWDQITSNFTASCSTDMIGKEARELPPFELTKHLVEMSAKKHDAASRSRRRDGEGEGEGEGESAADLTPFATSTFENERFKAAKLRSCSVGNGVYLVSADDEATNRVKMDFSPDGRLMECTCGFTSRFDMPCRHVLRVCMDENRMDVGKDFICEGYKLAAYRAANGDPRHAICPPVDMMLEADDTLPPQSVSDQAARPLKDPRPRKRVKSNGEAEPTGVHVAITTIAPSSKCSNPGPRAAPLLSSGGGTPPAGGAGARPSETPSQPEPPKPLSWK